MMETGIVITSPINALSWESAISTVSEWAQRKESRYVCICNVHSVITAEKDQDFARVIREADMSTPDGYPIAWALRKIGYKDQQRVNGPDLMWKYMSHAEKTGEKIFLYGNTEKTNETLISVLQAKFPNLCIAGYISPPYRSLTPDEDSKIIDTINESGAGTVWVSLGCPKQEKWMAAHRGKINAVMIGVGAAFDYHAGTIQRAPRWMQNNGLEWAHRFATEPRRLWKRYLTTNTLFVWKMTHAIATRKLTTQKSIKSQDRVATE